jgi:nucleoside-diphosphate-sugar epimerase
MRRDPTARRASFWIQAGSPRSAGSLKISLEEGIASTYQWYLKNRGAVVITH